MHRILHGAKCVAVGAGVAEHANQRRISRNQLSSIRVLAGAGSAVDARRPHDRRVDSVTKTLQRRDAQSLAGVDDVAPLVDGGRNVHFTWPHSGDERPENFRGQLRHIKKGKCDQEERRTIIKCCNANQDNIRACPEKKNVKAKLQKHVQRCLLQHSKPSKHTEQRSAE